MKRESVFVFVFIGMFLFLGIASAYSGFGINTKNTSNFQYNLNSALENNVQIPIQLEGLTKIVFGIGPESSVNVATFVILVISWFILLIFIHEGIRIMINKKFFSWAIAIIVNLLIAASGAIRETANFFFSLGTFVNLFNKYQILKLVIVLIVLGVVAYGLLHMIKKARNNAEIQINERAGVRAVTNRKSN